MTTVAGAPLASKWCCRWLPRDCPACMGRPKVRLPLWSFRHRSELLRSKKIVKNPWRSSSTWQKGLFKICLASGNAAKNAFNQSSNEFHVFFTTSNGEIFASNITCITRHFIWTLPPTKHHVFQGFKAAKAPVILDFPRFSTAETLSFHPQTAAVAIFEPKVGAHFDLKTSLKNFL